MSMFTIVHPTETLNAAAGTTEILALAMLGFGIAGIVVTLLMALKQKRSAGTSKADVLARN